MLLIAALSQKGGVGTSTIARLVARTYAAAGWKVKIADFHAKQMTSVAWNRIRLAAGIEPGLSAEVFGNVNTALRQSEYDLMVFDGCSTAKSTTLKIAKVAHLVLIPITASRDDLIPQIRFATELREHGVPKQSMLLVINGISDAGTRSYALRSELQSMGYDVAETSLPMRTAYGAALNSGRALSETASSSLNNKAESLMVEIAAKLSQESAAHPRSSVSQINKSLNFLVSEGFHRRFKVEAVRRHLSMKDMLYLMFEDWIRENPATTDR